jgi:hypothetical protein
LLGSLTTRALDADLLRLLGLAALGFSQLGAGRAQRSGRLLGDLALFVPEIPGGFGCYLLGEGGLGMGLGDLGGALRNVGKVDGPAQILLIRKGALRLVQDQPGLVQIRGRQLGSGPGAGASVCRPRIDQFDRRGSGAPDCHGDHDGENGGKGARNADGRGLHFVASRLNLVTLSIAA